MAVHRLLFRTRFSFLTEENWDEDFEFAASAPKNHPRTPRRNDIDNDGCALPRQSIASSHLLFFHGSAVVHDGRMVLGQYNGFISDVYI